MTEEATVAPDGDPPAEDRGHNNDSAEELQDMIAALDNEIPDLEAERATLKEEIKPAKDEIAAQKAQLRPKEKRYSELGKIIAKKKEQRADLEKRLLIAMGVNTSGPKDTEEIQGEIVSVVRFHGELGFTDIVEEIQTWEPSVSDERVRAAITALIKAKKLDTEGKGKSKTYFALEEGEADAA